MSQSNWVKEGTHVQYEPLHFDEIVERYERDVYQYSYFLVGKREYAEEIVQDVFLRVFRSIHLFRGESSFKTWVFTITRNVVQDFKRMLVARQAMFVDEVLTTEYSPSAENDYFQNNYKSEICDIVLTLPAVFSQVIILDVKYDRSMVEIATMLNISVGTVKSRLHRARIKMSTLLMRRDC
ncbi:hypothetical protein PMSD_09760 [Paenibacillus macquariensis subsp. defensor]|nr:hypothetical protein PMSD_09760 [Paenibacillus macquariensis subsp. defensor]